MRSFQPRLKPRHALGLLLIASLASCESFKTLKRDLEQLEEAKPLVVSVRCAEEADGPRVAAIFDADTQELVRLQLRHTDGPLEFTLLPGRYTVAAFIDFNENLEHEKGEWADIYGDPDVVTIGPEVTEAVRVELELGPPTSAPNAAKIALGKKLTAANPALELNNIGQVVPLSDARFADEEGHKGMWEPMAFVEEELHGIYMLQPYDPSASRCSSSTAWAAPRPPLKP